MKASRVKYILLVIRLLVGAALIFLALQGINWNLLAQTLGSLEPLWLTLAILSVLLGLGLKLARWDYLIIQGGIKMSLLNLGRAYFSGQAANILLPFRGGEAVRLGVAWSSEKSPHPAILTSIIFEKYLDLLLLSFCSVLALAFIPSIPPGWLKTSFLILAVISTILLAALMGYGPPAWNRMREKIPARFITSRLVRWFDQAIHSLAGYRSPAVILKALAATFAIWFVMAATNLLLFVALSIPADPLAAILVLISIYLGLLPALMPGNIGPFYFFAQLALQPFSIPLELSASFAIILHAIVTLPPLLLGGLGYFISSRPRPTPAAMP